MSEADSPQILEEQFSVQNPNVVVDTKSREVERKLGDLATASEGGHTGTELKLLTANEYRVRRSNTLLNRPEAQLEEHLEIVSYFGRQDPSYVEQINELSSLDTPMDPTCRLAVTVPAYNEGTRIYKTLEQYAKQDINPRMFEVVVFATPVENDTTPAEVARFKEKYPELSVVFVSKSWEDNEPATVGNGRKYAADIAMMRALNRAVTTKDTILVANDADTVSLEDKYLSSILEELDSHPSEDGLVTPIDIPYDATTKPNVMAAYNILTTFDELYVKGLPHEAKQAEPALTNGRSTALRMATYAAVGGYNPNAVIAEDWELGWMVADARDWRPECIKYFEGTRITTDPRRFIDTVVNRIPTDQQLFGFEQKPELRQLNNDEILGLVPDTFDWELFQDDADSIWHSRESGGNQRIPKQRFEALFDETMKELGVEYTVDSAGQLLLTSVEGLLKKVPSEGKPIEVVHSAPRVYTPELVQELRSYFSSLPVGVLESRQMKAQRVADGIQTAQVTGKVDEVALLQEELERFQ